MNEEEIMDIIKGKLLMIKRMLEEDDNDGHASAYEMQSEDFEAIQGLLKLYNKEKEKNKEHKTRVRNLECKIIRQKEQISGLRRKYHVDAWLEEDYISKDKIKAKTEPVLKQLERKMEEEYNKYGNSREYQDVVDAYNFLQSLLEKE